MGYECLPFVGNVFVNLGKLISKSYKLNVIEVLGTRTYLWGQCKPMLRCVC
jgi:hypothetical protein